MKLLITGSRGQVGCNLVEQATCRGWTLLACDYDELDITDRDAVLRQVTQFAPDLIINAAAHTAVDKAETEVSASYAINRDGPAYLAEAVQLVGAVMLHISTDYVFAGDKDGLYIESDAVDPQGVYGASKLAGELAVAELCPRHLILRTAWVFGEHGNNFVKTMLRLARERNELGIVSDQVGGPTYAGDIAHALLTMAEQAFRPEFTQWGVYHFAGEPHVSWFQFAGLIFEEAYQQGVLAHNVTLQPILTCNYPTAARRPLNSRLDCNKLTQVFALPSSNWIGALKNLNPYLPQDQ